MGSPVSRFGAGLTLHKVRLAGLAVLAAVVLFHWNGLSDQGEVGPTRSALPAGLGDRLRLLSDPADPARWSPCALEDVHADTEAFTLRFRCPDSGLLVADIRVPGSAGAAAGPGCLAQGSDVSPLAPYLRCTLRGEGSAERKEALSASIRLHLSEVIQGNPLVPVHDSAGMPRNSTRPHFDLGAALGWGGRDAATAVGLLLLGAFLWLFATGYFGFASLTFGRESLGDLVALVPLLLAVVARQGLTLHSIEEIGIQFYGGTLPGRHSLVYPMFQILTAQFSQDPQAFTLVFNGLLGSFATVPLYLFIRQRTQSRAVAVLAASFFALHPILARFMTSDGPYALVMCCWFTGLALLSQPEPGRRALFAGATFLGLAAACRMEGILFLAVSLALLDLPALVGAIRREPRAALGGMAAIVLLVGSQYYALLGFHTGGGMTVSDLLHGRKIPLPPLDLRRIASDVLWDMNDLGPPGQDPRRYAEVGGRVLLVLGAVLGLVFARLRMALGALAGALLLIAPYPGLFTSVVCIHHGLPSLAMRAIGAGLGLGCLVLGLARIHRRDWLVAVTTVAALAVPIATLQVWQSQLTVRYTFNEEYEMVRTAIAPRGVEPAGCSMLSFPVSAGVDNELHDFGQVTPALEVANCWTADCVSRVAAGHCVYYVRSASCFFFEGGAPPGCASDGTIHGDPRPCLSPRCARLEAAVSLRPLLEKSVDISHTFKEWGARFPARAPLGVYAVSPRPR